MKIHTVKFHKEFSAPIDKVWADFSNHENLGKIFGQRMSRIVDSSDAANVNGIDSVRKIHIPLLPFEETIRKAERPHLIEYQISKGTPLHHHYGSMIFKTLPNGNTELDYSIEMGSRYPFLGKIVAVVLEKSISESLDNYAKHCNK